MNTKVIFNTDKKLKTAAMKKSKEQGITLSAFLNLAMQGFVDNDYTIKMLDREIAVAREDVRKGRVKSPEDVFAALGI